MDPTRDGKDHINVYLKGRTVLGRMLSNLHWAPISLPDDGVFGTIEGYWYWLSVRDDRLRTLKGFECKKLGQQLRGRDWNQDPLFRTKIEKAIDWKIWSYASIAVPLRDSTLPFAHYYVYSQPLGPAKLVEVPESKWILDHIEYIRRWLQGKR